jgi:hypothetical protein
MVEINVGEVKNDADDGTDSLSLRRPSCIIGRSTSMMDGTIGIPDGDSGTTASLLAVVVSVLLVLAVDEG